MFAFAMGAGAVGAGVTGGVGVGDVVFVPPLHADVAAAMASTTATQVFLSIEVSPLGNRTNQCETSFEMSFRDLRHKRASSTSLSKRHAGNTRCVSFVPDREALSSLESYGKRSASPLNEIRRVLQVTRCVSTKSPTVVRQLFDLALRQADKWP